MTIVTTVVLTETSCGVCSIAFAVPETFWRRGQERGGSIWCPAGHEMTFGKSEVQRLREEAARHVQRLDQERAHRKTLERSNSALKGQVTKIKNRVGKGVCPCCNRHFANVERHMANQHPDYLGAGGD